MRNRRDDDRGFRGMGENAGRGYGGTEEQRRAWGRDRDRDDRDFGGRDFDRERMGGYGYGGYERGGGYGGYQGSYGMGDYGGAPGYGGYRGYGGRGGGMRGEGWGRRMGGTDRGFGYGEHEGMEARGPHYGKGPKGYRRSDERIREDVCDTIAQQGYIDASDVEVKVENGVVTLSGTVAARHEKRTLEQMVERVHGVDEVRNEMRLRREERMQGEARPQGQMQAPSAMPSSQQGQNGRAAR